MNQSLSPIDPLSASFCVNVNLLTGNGLVWECGVWQIRLNIYCIALSLQGEKLL